MRVPPLSVEEFRKAILNGNTQALARAITQCESTLDSDQKNSSELIQSLLLQTGKSIRVGITGVPGVGKSTFIETLGKHLTGLQKKIAVLAVDPSSGKTRGSILGDKTRMESLSKDPLAFVRPTPSSGHAGGVAGKTREAILLCEAAGYEIIFIETVGVGQSEIAVRGMVDFFLLLMLAGAGDELQGIKKGIIEMADTIVVNKADGENLIPAKRAQQDLIHALQYFSPSDAGWKPLVLTCSSTEKTGIEEIWQTIQTFVVQHQANGQWAETRKQQHQLWMEESLQAIMNEVRKNSTSFEKRKKELEESVRELKTYPPEAGRLLWNELFNR